MLRPLLSAVALLATISLACGGGGSTAPSPSAAAPGSPTAPPRVSIKVNWTAQTGANSGLWTAVEAGYFKDENLDVELVNIPSSSRSIAALIAKEVQLGTADVGNVVDAVAGGGGVKAVLSVTNRLVFSVMTKPEIKAPADLKGKRVGITTPGSSTHTAGLQALKLWGYTERDITFVPLTEVPNILAALITGQIDAGVVSPPTNTRAKASGFRELINLAIDGPNYPSVAIAATTDYIKSSPDVIKRFIKAYSRGVVRFREDKPFGTQTLRKYLKITDQAVLDDTWGQFSKYLELPPYVRGLDAVIVDASARTAAAKSVTPAQVFDDTFVKQLDDAGFFKGLGR